MPLDALSDLDLLRRFSAEHSAEAYRELVARHAPMVHATARRLLGNAADAEDACQTVFLILSRKASQGGLPAGTIPGGWLYRTTCFVAQAIKDDRKKRAAREREAASMCDRQLQLDPDSAELAELRRNLDAALDTLPEDSRAAVVLHHLEGRSLREVGQALGCSEDAARKRVSWALEKMRGRLQKRGLALSLLALTAGLNAQAAETVPATLLSKLSQSPPALSAGSSSSTVVVDAYHEHLAEEAMRAMQISQTNLVPGMLAAVAASLVLVVVILSFSDPAPQTPVARQTPPPTPVAVAVAAPTAETPKAEERKGWTLRGIVTDAAGQPIEGAVVYAYNGAPYQSAMEVGDRTLEWRTLPAAKLREYKAGNSRVGPAYTNAKGEYELSGMSPVSGGYAGSVEAYHPNHVPVVVKFDRNTRREGDTFQIETAVLPAGFAISGRVVDEAGNPLKDAFVGVQPAPRKIPLGPDGFPEYFEVDRTEFDLGEKRIVRTDAEGNFRLAGLRSANWSVAAWNAECPPTGQEVLVKESTGDAPLAIQLKKGKPLTVRVVTLPDNKPLANAYVWVGDFPVQRTNTAGQCEFTGLADAEHWVCVGPPDLKTDGHLDLTRQHISTPDFGVTKKSMPGELNVALLPAVDATVRVTDAVSGQPVNAARLYAKVIWDQFDRAHAWPDDREATVAKNGVYTLAGMRPGPWFIQVRANGYHMQVLKPVAIPFGAAEPLSVALTPATATFSARVVDHETGKPVAGAEVEAWEYEQGNSNAAGSVKTDQDGRFTLTRLLGGSAPLGFHVKAPGYQTKRVSLEHRDQRKTGLDLDGLVGKDFRRFASETHTFDSKGPRPETLADIRVIRTAELRGRLTDAQGQPAGKFPVTILRHGRDSGLKGSIMEYTATDASGKFTVTLPPGKYDVRYGNEKWNRVQTVELAPGDSRAMEFKLDEGAPKSEDF